MIVCLSILEFGCAMSISTDVCMQLCKVLSLMMCMLVCVLMVNKEALCSLYNCKWAIIAAILPTHCWLYHKIYCCTLHPFLLHSICVAWSAPILCCSVDSVKTKRCCGKPFAKLNGKTIQDMIVNSRDSVQDMVTTGRTRFDSSIPTCDGPS
jgi:hypothetical protein